MAVRVEALVVYPVKAMAGVSLARAEALAEGLAGDRQWLVIDPNGRAVTQRECPPLALLQPELTPDGLILHAGDASRCPVTATASEQPVTLFGQTAWGLAADSGANGWLSAQLGREVALVKIARPRPCDPERFGAHSTGFADAAPYLVASTASLAALPEPLQDRRRYRANLWVSGLPAFAEQTVRQLRVGDLTFDLVDPCQRCAVVLVDPDLGARTAEPRALLELAAINAMTNKPKAAAFGMNARLTAGAGATLIVGTEIGIHGGE